jgi:gliding motility-associated-like protein
VHPGTQTTYTVTESNGSCSASTTDVIKIKPSPSVTLTGTTSVCQNDTITLTATGGGTYEWSNGMTGNSISFVATTAGINNFYVIVTKGCADTTFTSVTVNPVSPVTACCDTTINLGGTAVIGATGATAYVWEPSGNVNCYTCPNTTATPTVNTTYTVVGTDADGCKSYATVTVDKACHDFDVPNVFTPNPSVSFPDNVFYIQGAIGQPNYELEIYDRWGVLVFKTTSTTDYWDGTNKGHECPDGVYYYIINATCDKNKYQKKGFVQIIRK